MPFLGHPPSVTHSREAIYPPGYRIDTAPFVGLEPRIVNFLALSISLPTANPYLPYSSQTTLDHRCIESLFRRPIIQGRPRLSGCKAAIPTPLRPMFAFGQFREKYDPRASRYDFMSYSC